MKGNSKKFFSIILLFLLTLTAFTACGCFLTPEDEPDPEPQDTTYRLALSYTAEDLAKILTDKDNLRVVWTSNKLNGETNAPYSWEYAVQSIGKKDANDFQEKIYSFTDYNGKSSIFHYCKSDKVICYEKSSQGSKWTKYTTYVPQNIDSTMVELLVSGILHQRNMGAFCQDKYFWAHTVKVKILNFDCIKLERQQEQNIVLYVNDDRLCLKWEDTNDATVGGRITKYDTDVTIAVPIVEE